MLKRLCTTADVKRVVDTSGRWTEDEINTEIENQTVDIYDECGNPIYPVKSYVGYNSNKSVFYMEYAVGEPYIYAIDRVFVGTTTKRELTETTDFTVAKKVGMIKLTSSTVAGQVLDQADDLLISYIPTSFSKYCALKTAEALLEKMDIITSGAASKELSMIRDKLSKHESLMNNKMGVVFSSAYTGFNNTYPLLKTITQDHSINKFLWKSD